MREIKFRAWDKDDKKMIEPFWLKSLVVNYCDEFNYSSIKDEDLFLANQNDLEFMQYTGLKDKKETWESDIVKHENGLLGVIKVSDNLTAYIETTDGGIYDLDNILSEEFEVMGNIYENPELLK